MDIMTSNDRDDGNLIPISSADDVKQKFPYMNNIILASKLINMWPNNRKRNRFLYHLVVWIVVINCVSFILSFGIQIQREFKNLDSVTALADFLTVFISATFRYIYVYVRGDKYLLLVSLLHNNFIRYSFIPTKNRKCLDRYYKLANKFILFYSTFTLFWILQLCSVPIITYLWVTLNADAELDKTEVEPVPYPVPMKVYAPFNYYKQPENVIFYIYQVAGFITFGIIYIAVDSFWYMVIFLSIGQFVLIKDTINGIKGILATIEGTEVELLESSQIQQVEEGLIQCIKHHQFMRKFVRFLDDINNPNILVDSLHAVISIGFILLDVTIALHLRDWNKVLYSVEYFLTSIVHMFLFDWLGNELAVKEEELAEAIYEIPWYRFPSQKTTLLLMAIQAKRPYRLTGGKIYKLSLEFFTSMIKAVFSCFTFLSQLRNGKMSPKN